MANPTAPFDSSGTAKMGFGIYLDGANDAPAWVRILNAAVVADETTKSGSMSVASMVAHDAVDVAAEGPVKVGGYASTAAPSAVAAADRVAAWFQLNGALMTGQVAHTVGGWTPYSALSTGAVLTAEIKGSAGQIGSLQCFNNGANEVFIRLYNQTGAPGSGDAANIIWRGMIPGNAAAAGFVVTIPIGIACATGIGVRVSAAVADNDTTALTANEVMVNVQYK
jgi:hypothetical protein